MHFCGNQPCVWFWFNEKLFLNSTPLHFLSVVRTYNNSIVFKVEFFSSRLFFWIISTFVTIMVNHKISFIIHLCQGFLGIMEIDWFLVLPVFHLLLFHLSITRWFFSSLLFFQVHTIVDCVPREKRRRFPYILPRFRYYFLSHLWENWGSGDEKRTLSP